MREREPRTVRVLLRANLELLYQNLDAIALNVVIQEGQRELSQPEVSTEHGLIGGDCRLVRLLGFLLLPTEALSFFSLLIFVLCVNWLLGHCWAIFESELLLKLAQDTFLTLLSIEELVVTILIGCSELLLVWLGIHRVLKLVILRLGLYSSWCLSNSLILRLNSRPASLADKEGAYV